MELFVILLTVNLKNDYVQGTFHPLELHLGFEELLAETIRSFQGNRADTLSMGLDIVATNLNAFSYDFRFGKDPSRSDAYLKFDTQLDVFRELLINHIKQHMPKLPSESEISFKKLIKDAMVIGYVPNNSKQLSVFDNSNSRSSPRI